MARPSLREKLASSAVETLHASGFNGCSIQDITDAAGVPKGSFFNHFENKEALAIDALRRYLENSRGDILFDNSHPPLERLRNHFTYLASKFEGCSFERGCLLGNFATEMTQEYPRMREELRQVFESWCGAVESVLREAQAAGDIDPQSIDLIVLGTSTPDNTFPATAVAVNVALFVGLEAFPAELVNRWR